MLNEVARDIEDPFHYDPNELPLPQVRPALPFPLTPAYASALISSEAAPRRVFPVF